MKIRCDLLLYILLCEPLQYYFIQVFRGSLKTMRENMCKDQSTQLSDHLTLSEKKLPF